MPLLLVKDDVTRLGCEVIVNATNMSLIPSGTVDTRIHLAAGPGLLEECRKIGGIETGEAVVTGGYGLGCRFVIHTAGPVWRGGCFGEEFSLRACYLTSLRLAFERGCRSIAFPLISAEDRRFPRDLLMDIAVDTVTSFSALAETDVYIAVDDLSEFELPDGLRSGVSGYLRSHYVPADGARLAAPEDLAEEKTYHREFSIQSPGPKPGKAAERKKAVSADRMRRSPSRPGKTDADECIQEASVRRSGYEPAARIISVPEQWSPFLEDGFSRTLCRLIDEKKISDVACYKKANVSKQTWHKILSDETYRPSKKTAISFAIALELDYEQTQALLATAGFTLSKSSLSDVIIEYFISTGNYNVFEIDEVLFKYDQETLASVR